MCVRDNVQTLQNIAEGKAKIDPVVARHAFDEVKEHGHKMRHCNQHIEDEVMQPTRDLLASAGKRLGYKPADCSL